MGDCNQQQRGEGDEGVGDRGLGAAGEADHGDPEGGGCSLPGSLLQPHLGESHQAEWITHSQSEVPRSYNRAFLCIGSHHYAIETHRRKALGA